MSETNNGKLTKDCITPEVKTLAELFDTEEYNYIIPGYQRPYEWDSKQIENAFEAIKDNFRKKEICVFGTVQLNQLEENKYEIIDGQQRLTTFWLFLLALGRCEGLKFCPENEINSEYKSDLENIHGKYRENYSSIVKLIDEGCDEGEEKEKYKNELKQYIQSEIIFVVIKTNFGNDSVEKTIQIFDSLNTTGLPLDTKDLFKIKFRDYVAAKENQEDIFKEINEAYDTVTIIDGIEPIYYLSEEDLLSVFKYWIIGKSSFGTKISASKMKQGNKEFFYEKFHSKENSPEITLENLKSIADTMMQTQKILKIMDQQNSSGTSSLLYAKELLYWSGYSRIKNLFYVFVYAQAKGNSVEEYHVTMALELTELLWKMCSVFHASVGQIINVVFEFIGNEIVKKVIVDGEINISIITEEIRKVVSENWHLKDNKFSNVILHDVFNNTRRDLFLALSYIDDSEGETAFDVKSKLFYYDKWELDIEHIISRHFGENHQIGNLMYLEKKINRSLGQDTKNFDNLTDDIKNKLRKYEDSKLNSVVRFRNDYVSSKLPNEENIKEIISDRNQKKQAMLKRYYECIYDFKTDE